MKIKQFADFRSEDFEFEKSIDKTLGYKFT